VAAEVAELEPLDIVMGLEINGDALAYPVLILNTREMVDDVVGGGAFSSPGDRFAIPVSCTTGE